MKPKENYSTESKQPHMAVKSPSQVGPFFEDASLRCPAIVRMHSNHLVVEIASTTFTFELAFSIKYRLIFSQKRNESNAEQGDLGVQEPIGIELEATHQKGPLVLYSDSPQLLTQFYNLLTDRQTRSNFHLLYKAIRKIGKGTTATVYLGQRLIDGTEVAVKAFPKETLMVDPKGMEALSNEINVMRLLDHRNILQLLEVFETQNSIYLCTEYLKGGQLYNRIMNERLSFGKIQLYLRQMLQALVVMEQAGIIHRDLKPENIIYREVGGEELVLGDFGLGTHQNSKQHIYVRCGTPGFAAPEILTSKAGDPQKCISDMFSVGIIAFFMVYRRLPYKGTTVADISRQNRKCEFDFPSNITDRMDPFLVDLMLRMIQADPEKRISAKSALNHRFFQKNFSEEETVSEQNGRLCECYRELNRMQKEQLVKLADSLGTFMMGKTNTLREPDSPDHMGSFEVITFSPTANITPSTEGGTPVNNYVPKLFSELSAAKSQYFSEGLPIKKVHLAEKAKKVTLEQLYQN